MNTAETIRKAINATKGRLTKRQAKAYLLTGLVGLGLILLVAVAG